MSLRLLGYSLFLIALTPFKIPGAAPVEQGTESQPIIPKWEYKVLRFDAGQCSSEAALAGPLNSLGREGWELVAHERLSPPYPNDAQGTLLIRPAATGPGSSVAPQTADSFQGTITMKMGQMQPGGCLLMLKRQVLLPSRQ